MAKSDKIFVVVDPSSVRHFALERVLITARLQQKRPEIKVFVAVDSMSVDTRVVNNNLFRDQSWFQEEIREPIEKADLDYSIEVSWSSEWQKSICKSSKAFGADVIYLPMKERSRHSRFSFSDSKWELLKTASCPVVLIQPGAEEKREVVVAAVNFQAQRDEQKDLNRSILNWGKTIAEIYGASFHVVNAYLDSMNYPDRGKLARETGLPADSLHVEQGWTDEVVAKVASELGANLVVLGTLGQNGAIASRRGNTAERVIAGLPQDIMVVNH